MIEFVYPWFFVLLLLPAFIVWLAPAYKARRDSIQVPYFASLVDVTGEKPQKGAVLLSRTNIQRFLVAFSWLCFVTAMAKPEKIGAPIIQQKSARDLMIAVDLSGSMTVQDFTLSNGQVVDRLTAVKQVLTEFVSDRKHDRLGLILFGDAPYLQAPFTADIPTWLTLLMETEIGMAGQSTALGDAIGLSISVFEKSKTKNRVLVLLTDGNDNNSKVPPFDAAKVAAAYDIKIYTIAVGDPTTIGEEKIDLAVLEQLTAITGGQNFQALNRSELTDAYQKINALEPELFDTLSFRPKTSVHHYPIIAFSIFYILALAFVNFRFYLENKKLENNSSSLDGIKNND